MTAKKRSWRSREIGKERIEAAIRGSKSLSEAARKLGVNKSSVSRWARLMGPSNNVVSMPLTVEDEPPAEARTDAEAWAEWIRERYELTASEEQLLGLAVLALRMAHDEEQPATVRVQSMGRFQQLLKQLDLEGGG